MRIPVLHPARTKTLNEERKRTYQHETQTTCNGAPRSENSSVRIVVEEVPGGHGPLAFSPIRGCRCIKLGTTNTEFPSRSMCTATGGQEVASLRA
jgi:hypothetical protein